MIRGGWAASGGSCEPAADARERLLRETGPQLIEQLLGRGPQVSQVDKHQIKDAPFGRRVAAADRFQLPAHPSREACHLAGEHQVG